MRTLPQILCFMLLVPGVLYGQAATQHSDSAPNSSDVAAELGTRAPWYVAPGDPKNAHLSTVYAGIRYVLAVYGRNPAARSLSQLRICGRLFKSWIIGRQRQNACADRTKTCGNQFPGFIL